MRLLVTTSSLALVAISAVPASAQTAAPASDAQKAQESDIQDIVVTAQRREERLQDVPIAVTAVSGATLGRFGSSDVTDLGRSVPGLKVTNNNGQVAPRLRGIGSTATGPGVENSIAIYVDGVYYGSTVASILSLNNVQRVEVLKGPQGTLFGRNSTGGLIQIITRTPQQTPSLETNISYANYDTVTANAYLTGGLARNLAMDVSLQYIHQGKGWGTNLGTGDENYKIDQDFTVRSKLLFDPGGGTRITLSGDYAYTDNSMNSAVLLAGTRAFPTSAPVTYPEKYDGNTNHDSYTRGWQAGGSLTVAQTLGTLSLTSITAYRASHYTRAFDFDLTTNPQPNPVPSNPYRYFVVPQRDRQFSQELQLTSGKTGPLTWVIGAFYYKARGGFDPAQFYFEAPVGPVAPDGPLVDITDEVKTESIAGYAQGTLALGSATNLTMGIRYTHEKKSITGSQDRFIIPAYTPAPIAAIVLPPAITANKPSYRVSLDHHFTPDIMVYASFNRGFKSGGFSATSPGDPGYLPEQVDAYEAGVKTEVFDRRLRANVAVFHYDYTNIQIQTVGPTGTVTTNGAAARINGLDVDFDASVTNALRITGGLQLIDDKFKSYPNALIGTPLGGVDQTLGSATGNRLPLASRTSLSVTPMYRIDLPDGRSVDLSATYYYNSGWFPEADNVIRQPAFSQYDASVRWTIDPHLSITLWGKNLSDVQTFASKVTVPGGRHFVIWGPPRTYGFTLSSKF